MLSTLDRTFRVPATRGKRGNAWYYTATLPFGVVNQLLANNPDTRSRRALDTESVPVVAVSMQSDQVEFVALAGGVDVGELVLPIQAKYVIYGGRDRVAGIAEALRSDPTLAQDTISVVFLPYGGTELKHHMFSDPRRAVRQPAKPTVVEDAQRLPAGRIAIACMEQVDLFRGRIGKGRGTPSNSSPNFATLVALQEANEQLLGKSGARIGPAAEKKRTAWAIDYWNHLAGLVEPWSNIVNGAMSPQDARREYVSSSAQALWVLGAVGRTVSAWAKRGNEKWEDALAGLAKIDWRKSNPDWQGICMAEHEVVSRKPALQATTHYILWKIGLIEEPPEPAISETRMATATARRKALQENRDSEAEDTIPDYDQGKEPPRMGALHARWGRLFKTLKRRPA